MDASTIKTPVVGIEARAVAPLRPTQKSILPMLSLALLKRQFDFLRIGQASKNG
jgi:hypothetical protein